MTQLTDTSSDFLDFSHEMAAAINKTKSKRLKDSTNKAYQSHISGKYGVVTVLPKYNSAVQKQGKKQENKLFYYHHLIM